MTELAGPQSSETASMPPIPERPALFLDVDGTLLEIASRPESVRADAAIVSLLAAVSRALGGALALVSGRSIAQIDSLFAPLRLPAAGLHGLEFRSEAAPPSTEPRADALPAVVCEALAKFVADHPGLQLEDKRAAIAIHFRHGPAHLEALDRMLADVLSRLGPSYHVQQGLLVRELKPSQLNKRSALNRFMAQPPFAGRTPIAVGDDLTDRDAFAAAEAHGGYAIAIGYRVDARYRLPDPRALREWLARLAQRGPMADARDAG